MSQSTASVSRRDILVDRYFEAWRQHDVSAIRDIFAATASYEIQGKSVRNGIESHNLLFTKPYRRLQILAV
jgi:hypothetical protein